MQYRALYIVNLIDANLRGTAKIDSPKLSDVVDGDGKNAPLTFGEKESALYCKEGAFFDAARAALQGGRTVAIRNQEAHDGDDSREVYLSDETDALIEALEKVSTVKVNRDYSLVPTFAELERAIFRALEAKDIYSPSNTLGKTALFLLRSGKVSKSTVNWIWKFANIRNRYVHGATITKRERDFIATIAARIERI